MKRIAFIGLGKQNTEDHLLAAQKNKDTIVVAVCDSNPLAAREWSETLKIPGYTSVEQLLKSHTLDAAVIAVPHSEYLPIMTRLMESGVHILKEKPFALSLDEAKQMSDLATKHNVKLSVAVQRKHSRVFQTYMEYAPRIGELFSIHGEYTLNIAKLDEGWRSSRKMAGGGAVIDMGYHLLDLITWYFGLPDRISADLGYHNRSEQDYDVEDTAKIQFSYIHGERKVLGSILLSRIYPAKDEGLFIYGIDGAIKIYKERIELYNASRELIESRFVKSDGGDISTQFDAFIESLDKKDDTGNYKEHLLNMVFIDAIYRSDNEAIMVSTADDVRYNHILGSDKKEILIYDK